MGILPKDGEFGDAQNGEAAGPENFAAPLAPGTYEIVANYQPCAGQDVPSTGRATLIVNAATTLAPATTSAPTTTLAPTTTIAGAVAPTAPPTTLATVLPETGQTSDGLVWAALAALLLGGGFVMVAARRS